VPGNHLGADNFLRAENWARNISQYMLLGDTSAMVALTLDGGTALVRYREEMTMYANLEAMAADGSHNQLVCDNLMQDPGFWTRHAVRIAEEWPSSRVRGIWWRNFSELAARLDVEIARRPGGAAFVKLSVRSPKDGVFACARFQDYLREEAATITCSMGSHGMSGNGPKPAERHDMTGTLAVPRPPAAAAVEGTPGTLSLSQEVHAINRAGWRAMRVTSGWEAVDLLLRSDRAYMDVLQQELFSSAPGASSGFDLNVHIFSWFDGLDPDWEFRGFVNQGVRTGLTAYNPWVYSPRQARLTFIVILFQRIAPADVNFVKAHIVLLISLLWFCCALQLQNKQRLLEIITTVWDAVQPKLSSVTENYSIDFAVDPAMTGSAWVVEVPPPPPVLVPATQPTHHHHHHAPPLPPPPPPTRTQTLAQTQTQTQTQTQNANDNQHNHLEASSYSSGTEVPMPRCHNVSPLIRRHCSTASRHLSSTHPSTAWTHLMFQPDKQLPATVGWRRSIPVRTCCRPPAYRGGAI